MKYTYFNLLKDSERFIWYMWYMWFMWYIILRLIFIKVKVEGAIVLILK